MTTTSLDARNAPGRHAGNETPDSLLREIIPYIGQNVSQLIQSGVGLYPFFCHSTDLINGVQVGRTCWPNHALYDSSDFVIFEYRPLRAL